MTPMHSHLTRTAFAAISVAPSAALMGGMVRRRCCMTYASFGYVWKDDHGSGPEKK